MTGTIFTPSARITAPVRLALAVLALGLLARLAILHMWDAHPPDLSGLWMAGHLYHTGAYDLIYAHPEGFFGGSPAAWAPLLKAHGLDGAEVLPFVYPPLWAAVMAPVSAALSPAAFFHAADIVLILLLAASVPLAWRLARGWAMPLWAWTLTGTALLATSLASYTAMVQLQPQILVTFLCLLAFESARSGRSATGGAVLALAAALKLAPVLLVLIFLVERDRRALAGFAIAGAALAAASLASGGPDLHFAMRESLAAASQGVFLTAITHTVESLLTMAGAGLGLLPALDHRGALTPVADTPLPLTCATLLLFAAATIWMLRATRPLPDDRRVAVRLFLLGLLVNLFGPLGWIHYYLLQLFLLPMLPALLPGGLGLACLLAVAILTSWPVFLLPGIGGIPAHLLRSGMGTGVFLLLFAVITAALHRRRRAA